MVDMSHKLCTFILKEAKKNKKKSKDSGSKDKDKKGKKSKKAKKKKEKDQAAAAAAAAAPKVAKKDNEVEFETATTAEAIAARREEEMAARGNGIKTVIDNCAEVSEQLNRPPQYLTKFLGIELAAQSRWKEAEQRSIVNGAFQDSDLQNMVHKFVDIFVLCPTCKYPETKLKISTKSKTITHHCKACGSKNMVDKLV